MNRIEREFEDRVDFFHFNVDVADYTKTREELGLFRRTTYMLLDAEGNELRTWIGYLDQEVLLEQMEALLAQLEAG